MVTALAVIGISVEVAYAQPRPSGSPRQSIVSNFERGSPAIGDALPDISGYDAKGKEFHLRSLKGNYTVLVFGCLT
ncbi:MAG: hypothetical protein CMJ78_00185 [Planctomycetaceae bacterium]|nr:hypothetical protein [Planctomycetaceae bacterium]